MECQSFNGWILKIESFFFNSIQTLISISLTKYLILNLNHCIKQIINFQKFIKNNIFETYTQPSNKGNLN